MTSICSELVVQVVSALLRGSWQDFNWHDASRRPSAIAELLPPNQHHQKHWRQKHWKQSMLCNGLCKKLNRNISRCYSSYLTKNRIKRTIERLFTGRNYSSTLWKRLGKTPRYLTLSVHIISRPPKVVKLQKALLYFGKCFGLCFCLSVCRIT